MTELTAAVLSQIDAAHDAMRIGFAEGRPDLILNAFYAEEPWIVGDQGNTWRGKKSVLALYTGICGVYSWHRQREALIPLGADAATEFLIGKIVPTDGDPEKETLIYKIQLNWAEQGGSWRCVSQFFAYGTDFRSM